MKHSIGFLMVFMLCSIHNIIAQQDAQTAFTLPEITRPSPTVAQLMKFEEVSLSHYTGQPNIAIPLFSKNANGLAYNLALQYRVSGIRVNEQSGWVGKGWALETGGVISRSVVGLPDEINSSVLGFTGINHTPFHDLGYYESEFNGQIISGTNHDEAYYFNALWGTDNAEYDYYRDIYQFNFFGHSGRFIFVKENDILVPKIIGNDSKLKITVAYESDTTNPLHYGQVIAHFTVTDNNGFVYTFDQVETTEKRDIFTTKYRGSTAPSLSERQVPAFRSAWKLSEVKTLAGDTVISFSYKDVEEKPETVNSKSVSRLQVSCDVYNQLQTLYTTTLGRNNNNGINLYFEVLWEILKAHYKLANENRINAIIAAAHNVSAPLPYQDNYFGGGIGNPNLCGWQPGCDETAYEPGYNSSRTLLTIQSKKIEAVTFNDGVSLHFDSNNTGHPEYQGAQLNSIHIKLNGNTDKTYELDYNTAMRSITNDPNATYDGLLFLETLQVKVPGTTLTEGYSFEYNYLENLKPLGKTRHDDFGYYRSENVEDYKDQVISGALSRINYPTGGARAYKWQSNTYSYSGDRLLRFNEIFENPDNYNITTTNLVYNGTGVGSIGPHNNLHFTVNPTQNVNIEFTIVDDPFASGSSAYSYQIEFIPVDSNNQRDLSREIVTTGYSGNDTVTVRAIAFEAGKYVIGQVFNQYGGTFADPFNIELSIKLKNLNPGPLNWWRYGGGLRIARIQDYDNDVNKQQTVVSYALEPIVGALGLGTLPSPNDYPGNPDPLIGGANPVHYFSSGSLDGESKLTRSYLYSKSILDFEIGTWDENNKAYYYVLEHQNELNAQLTQGSFIGYKNVAQYRNSGLSTAFDSERIVTGKPVTKYVFDSPIDYPIYPQLYTYPFEPVIDRDYLRGNLRTQTVYAVYNNNQIRKLSKTNNSYNYDNDTNIEVAQAQKLHFNINENSFSNTQNFIRTSYRNHAELLTGTPNTSASSRRNCSGQNTVYEYLDDLSLSTLSSYSTGITTALAQYIDEFSYKVQLTASDTKEYFYNDLGGASTKEVHQEYTYAPENYQVRTQNTSYKEKGVDEIYRTENFYPHDNVTSTASTVKEALRTLNKINEVLETKTFKNNVQLSQTNTIYHEFATGIVLPKDLESLKGVPSATNTPEPRIHYKAYDNLGNPLEVQKADGIPISYIWGYDKTLPVAKIVNASRSQIIDALNDDNLNVIADFHTGAGSLTLAQITALRDHLPKGAQMTTYEYDPLLGVTKMTDPRGYTMTYEYDEFNRLKFVKDQDGHIVSHNKYHYSTQN